GLQAVNLSLINIIPLFASPYLNFLIDILRVSLNIYRRVYRLVRIISFILLLFYIFTVMASQNSFPLCVAENI
ncbi:uncharacterized protein K441DRAFT_586055, partial [Cenococcum geophilum 1.58]|uniref:uncharacterized protein n=1 Tax=Cenococcum geophilum 1.58 TaxID=794803 RepID=UPI00358F0550